MASNSKQYKEHYKRLLYIEQDKGKFLHELIKVISLGEYEKVKKLVDLLKKEGQLRLLHNYRENDGESVLHIAAKFNQSSDIIQYLIKACPELLPAARKATDNYYGQTALHIAIAKGNTDTVETMLSETLNHSQTLRAALLHQLATGSKFINTVMMGELPLSVAALTFNKEMIDILLQNGAELERINTKGDTVFHSLIRFVAIYPEHTNAVLSTLEYLHCQIKEKMAGQASDNVLSMEYDHRDFTYIWFVSNKEDLNPLQLAASLSQPTIFQYILGLPHVYCFLNNHDGLFDRKLYDITEIDTIATEQWASHQRHRHHRLKRHIAPSDVDGVSKRTSSTSSVSCFPSNLCSCCLREQRKSVLEIMFDIKGKAAYDFIQISTLRHIIKAKWMYYRWFYYGWMLFHFMFMIVMTTYSVLKTEQISLINTSSVQPTEPARNTARDQFLDVWSYFYLVIGCVYLLQEVFHLLFRSKSFHLVQLTNILHNTPYRLLLLLFSLCLIVDFVLVKAVTGYENYALIIALITGWWFMVFFLRAQKRFSFFTVMIQKVIFGDMLRFFVIIILVLVAFTAGMYMTFKDSSQEAEELHTYGSTMMLLFKLMLGLGDIETLYEARQPWVAITLFVIFVLLTYVLMFNALIAMMAQTCTLVSENRHVQWRVQQLSVILFFEGILPSVLQKRVGTEKHVKRFDPNLKQVVEERRYFLDISSIQTEYASAEDIYHLRNKLQTLPFGDQRTYSPNFLMTMTTPTPTFFKGQNFDRAGSRRHVAYYADPRADNYRADNPRGTEITVNPAPSATVDTPKSPNIKRRKSKRERKISEKTPRPNSDYAPDTPDSFKQTTPSPNSAIRRKQRVEPEGDYLPHDNLQPNGFYTSREPFANYLNVPGKPTELQVDPAGRRRTHSENDLLDTHIGAPGRSPAPGKRVQLSVEPISHLARPNPQQQGSLNIGVIDDSYM